MRLKVPKIRTFPHSMMQSEPRVRKRRRPALACLTCYERKLKCTREHPICERCAKAGQECIYREKFPQVRPNHRHNQPDLSDEAPTTRPGSGRGTGSEVTDHHSGGKDATIWMLTPASSAHGQEQQHHHHRSPSTREVQAVEVAICKEKDVYSRFYGYSYLRNSYQQFEGLRSYIRQLKTQYPISNRLQHDLHVTKKRREHAGGRIGPVSLSDLRGLFPVKAIADELLKIYITRFESMYRVLHLPTLREEYSNFWETSATSTSTMPTTTIVQLLLVLATALSLREMAPSLAVREGNAITITRDTATRWIEACDSWLSSSIPHGNSSYSWALLSLTTLTILAKHANQIRRHEFWTSTGALLRQAMAAGYHRETHHTTMTVSPFHREMRRRLWATIVELDLQACLERGMPPTLRRGDFNTHSPLNIDDEMLRKDMREPPTEMPLESLTDTSFQVTMYRSLDVRLRVCELINASTVETDFSNIMTLDQEIMQSIRAIPSTWDMESTRETGHGDPLYLRTMLDQCLHHQLVLLHMPFATMARHDARFGHCRRSRLEAATHIVSKFQMLVDRGLVPASWCRNEVIQAAMTICHEIYLDDGGYGSPSITATAPILAESFLSISERALSMIESAISVLGKGRNEHYILAMVLALVKSKLWPARVVLFRDEAVDRIVHVHMVPGTTTAAVPAAQTELASASCVSSDQVISNDDALSSLDPAVFDPMNLDFLQDELDPDLFGTWNADEIFGLDHDGDGHGMDGHGVAGYSF